MYCLLIGHFYYELLMNSTSLTANALSTTETYFLIPTALLGKRSAKSLKKTIDITTTSKPEKKNNNKEEFEHSTEIKQNEEKHDRTFMFVKQLLGHLNLC
mgnify:CR=1 FL=1